MAPIGVQTYPNRPSRLLNLNRSFMPQKRIATANAATSPFLKLPPELRSRIYDYVFGSNLVHIAAYPHIENRAKRVGYRISSCTCEGYDTRLSPRVRSYEHDTAPDEVFTEACQGCAASFARQASASQAYCLSLLQVCRQIYHEAALKPFQQGLFIYDFDKDCSKGEGLQAFMNALVPVQVNSIRRLQLWGPRPAFLRSSKLAKLKGLRHLMMRLDFKVVSSDQVLLLLESFAGDPIVLRLADLDLKSCRLDLGIHTPGHHVRRALALLGSTVKIPTAEDAEIFEEVLKRTEAALLQAVGQ